MTTATRMLPSLLAVIASDLDVSVVTVGVYVGIGQLSGLAAPLVGSLVRRSTANVVSRGALAGFCATAVAVALAPSVWVFGPLLVVLGVMSMGYEASATAWITQTAPFESRSRLLGRFELPWSMGLLVGVPIATLLATGSWRLSYLAVALLAGAVSLQLNRRLSPRPASAAPQPRRAGRSRVRAIPLVGWLTFLAFALVGGAAQIVIVVFGVWLTEQFDFGVSSIGAVAFVFGLGEMGAAVATIRLTDQIGNARAARVGAMLLAVSAAVLAAASSQLVIGVIALTALLVSHEFAFISTKPVLADAFPDEPAIGIGLGFGTAAAVRGAASVAGTAAFSAHGMPLAAALGASLAVLAFVLFRLIPQPSPDR